MDGTYFGINGKRSEDVHTYTLVLIWGYVTFSIDNLERGLQHPLRKICFRKTLRKTRFNLFGIPKIKNKRSILRKLDPFQLSLLQGIYTYMDYNHV